MITNRKEKSIIAISYMIGVFLLFIFVPKDKIRQAQIPFLFKQATTWFFGLIVVEKNLIEYPYRPFFKKTYKASFCFEYFLYPVFSILFNLYYPEKRNIIVKALYNLFHTSLLVGSEVLIAKYTKLIRYKKWAWYWSFLTIWLSNYLSHAYYKWFFKDDSLN